jgi:hypothetical protein
VGVIPGTSLIKEICRVLETRPQMLIIVECPYCQAPEGLEMDPSARSYWCRYCNKRGKLEELQIVAEGVFLRRHSYSRQLMEQRPGPGWEREGGRRR